MSLDLPTTSPPLGPPDRRSLPSTAQPIFLSPWGGDREAKPAKQAVAWRAGGAGQGSNAGVGVPGPIPSGRRPVDLRAAGRYVQRIGRRRVHAFPPRNSAIAAMASLFAASVPIVIRSAFGKP